MASQIEAKQLYHVSPKSRRKSIQQHGIRRTSWFVDELVVHATTQHELSSARLMVADRHDVLPSQCDTWELRCMESCCLYVGYGRWLINADIPPSQISLFQEACK